MRNYPIDGKDYEFDFTRFQYCLDERYRQENKAFLDSRNEKSAKKQRKTKGALLREIADVVNLTEDAVKNWLRKSNRNAPGDEEKVYDLEDFFHVGRGYFLKPVLNEKENAHMNTAYTVQKTDNHEMDAAKNLYISILDAISATEITSVDFINANLRVPVHRGMSENRYKLILEIRKTAMDLPESVRLPSMELVNDIYGPERDEPYAFYETEDFKAYINSDDYQAYLKTPNAPLLPPELVDDYQAYLESIPQPRPWEMFDGLTEEQKQAIQAHDVNTDREMHYLNYADYKTAEFYRRLDEIFADYIKR